jgi:hypothetical protein
MHKHIFMLLVAVCTVEDMIAVYNVSTSLPAFGFDYRVSMLSDPHTKWLNIHDLLTTITDVLSNYDC